MVSHATETPFLTPYEAFEQDDFGAWVLVCNPSLFDVRGMSEDGATSGSWTVNRRAPARTNLMESGQRVLLWMTGKSDYPRGFWASGKLTSKVFIDDFVYSDDWLDIRDREEVAFVGYDIDFFLNGTDASALKDSDELRTIEPLRAPQVGPPFVTLQQLRALNCLLESPFEDLSPAPKPSTRAPLPVLKRVDIEHRRRTEFVGMSSAASFYEDYGYQVADVALEKCGYDLLAKRELEFEKHVEAKGLTNEYPYINLTRSEIATAKTDPNWQLFVATEAHHEDGPICRVYSRERVLDALYSHGLAEGDLVERRAVRVNLSKTIAEFSFVGILAEE